MEQCRSVNPFMPTRVLNPFKLTDRSVIIGSLLLFYHFTEIVVSFKQTVKTLIRHYFIHHLPCVYVGSALFVKFLYMGARPYWAFKMTVFK